jgi:glycerophosphoryl diester phosphodiesterase
MPAFERALEIGVDAIETDVHVTRDGHLIVSHDETATRMTGARVAWADITLADVRRLDAGWGFVARDGSRPFAGRGVTIPAFEELLVAFPTTQLNVDLKEPRAIAPMIELVRAHRAEERVTIASFHTSTAIAVRRRGYGGETALSQGEVATLIGLPAVLWRQLPLTGNAAQVPTKQGPLRFDRPAFVAKCHAIGLRIDYWVIDDPAEARRLLDLGADGIMTNDPAAIRPVFA